MAQKIIAHLFPESRRLSAWNLTGFAFDSPKSFLDGRYSIGQGVAGGRYD